MTLGSPPPAKVWPCPKCGVTACSVGTGGSVICTCCYAVWTSLASFESVTSFYSELAAMGVDDAKAEYIDSGQMKEDIEKVIVQAVAEKMLNFTHWLAFDVQQILDQNVSPEQRMRNIRELVRRHRDEAQMDWAEVADGDED